ncbi:hypothetical protein Cni_G09552 [Canna indica]|uniref:Uncharacterized protein n=1 Tax=Canna indica TaxID=4628 RepID=A0AAQ3Q7T9_9LILI|nr:hypothetical protein Cni_G09552 [Canna indica]
MQDQRITSEEVSIVKSRKKKPMNQMASTVQIKGESGGNKEASNPPSRPQKGSKRSLKSDGSLPFQQTFRSTPDSFTDPSGSSDEYRALRRKYLLLEEESFSLDRELNEVDAEVKTLEDEKLALLDQLVVLEGLVDPSEIKHEGGL